MNTSVIFVFPSFKYSIGIIMTSFFLETHITGESQDSRQVHNRTYELQGVPSPLNVSKRVYGDALCWLKLHPLESCLGLLSWWKESHPISPSQCCALYLSGIRSKQQNKFMDLSAQLWLTSHQEEVQHRLLELQRARRSLFLTFVPSGDRATVCTSLMQPKSSVSIRWMYLEPLRWPLMSSEFLAGALAWGEEEGLELMSSFSMDCECVHTWKQSMQFLVLYGHQSPMDDHRKSLDCVRNQKYNRREAVQSVDKFDVTLSNNELCFHEGQTSCTRTNIVLSPYPAALCVISSASVSFAVSIEACGSSENWLTIGIAEKHAVRAYSSWGFGRSEYYNLI